MKKILPLFFLFFIACQNNSTPDNTAPVQQTDTVVNTPLISDSTIVLKETVPLKNQKDKYGKKQGMWDYYEDGYLKGFKTYKNDTLNGYFKYWQSHQQRITEGYYLNGKLEGISKDYYNYSICEIANVEYHKNGKLLWMGFPHAEQFYFPVKNFIIRSDSVYIKCPYENDVIWYEGLVIKKEPVGIHKMYHPNGKLKFEADYNLKTVIEFDSAGTLVSKKKDHDMQRWQ